ncbi:MAG: hypothetical protein WA993_11285 [Candidatus Binatus sp.]
MAAAASRKADNRKSMVAVSDQNLNPDVMMMEPSKDRNRCYTADLLLPAEIRSIFVQGEMGPDFVVIRSVCLQDIAQAGFAKHDEVVE